MRTGLAFCALLALLLAAPAVAAPPGSIPPGVDLWRTIGNGTTHADFAGHPIPADFFCPGSAPFTGRVDFRGEPLTTKGGIAGNADTIVERLDEAVFNGRGLATTRVQLRALSLAGISPIETSCGRYLVHAGLAPNQPVTRMEIYRDHDRGGHFISALALDIKFTFVPLPGSRGEVREIVQRIQSVRTNHQWADRPGRNGIAIDGFLLADTDNDRRPDTYLATSTGFHAGWSLPADQRAVLEPNPTTVPSVLTATDGHAVTPPTSSDQ